MSTTRSAAPSTPANSIRRWPPPTRIWPAFDAHQKLESLFAALRGDNDPLFLRERARVTADGLDDTPQPQFGRYQVRSTLGAGAFGTVYLAHDPELNREVAVKLSSPSVSAGAKAAEIEKRAEAIAAEARHAASLNHPNIVTIYDVGRKGDRLYIVMQYVAGRTLADAIASGPFVSDRAAELLATGVYDLSNHGRP